MTFLVDTNVFLEILLNRAKKESCKRFLEKNIGELSITDFSLHSIGLILFRYHKKDLFSDCSRIQNKYDYILIHDTFIF